MKDEEWFKKFEVEEMPEGWKVIEGTLTQPRGYVWISNGQSLFARDKNGNKLYKQALIKEEKVIRGE